MQLERVAQFGAVSVAHFAPVEVAQFRAVGVAQFGRYTHLIDKPGVSALTILPFPT